MYIYTECLWGYSLGVEHLTTYIPSAAVLSGLWAGKGAFTHDYVTFNMLRRHKEENKKHLCSYHPA